MLIFFKEKNEPGCLDGEKFAHVRLDVVIFVGLDVRQASRHVDHGLQSVEHRGHRTEVMLDQVEVRQFVVEGTSGKAVFHG